MAVDIPQFDLPFRISDAGTEAVVEQDSDKDINNAVESLARTRVGDRPARPTVGRSDKMLLSTSIDGMQQEIKRMINKYEPRARDVYTEREIEDLVVRIRVKVGGNVG